VLAEQIGRDDSATFKSAFEEEYLALVGELWPHMDAVEATVYGEVERLLDLPDSMAPMRREHDQMRKLIDVMAHYRSHVAGDRLSTIDGLALRRALYRLYSILRVHLAEEGLYLEILDRGLTDQEKESLARGIDHATTESL